MYQQPLAATGADCVVATKMTTKVVLFQNENTTTPVTTGVQVTNALTYARSVGVDIAIGTTLAGITVAFEQGQDLTVADVIRRCLQWTPDAVGWFDYSTASPTFNAQVRASLTGSTVSLDSEPAVVEKFDIQSRNDLVPSGVRFNYLGTKVCPQTPAVPGCAAPVAGGGDHQVTVVTVDEVGTPDAPGGLIGTVQLAQISATASEPAPAGLAALYWASLKPVGWGGTITTREFQCSGAVRVGRVLNVLGGLSDWTSMNALVQEVEEIISTGETIIRIGPPSHLAPQDFVTLIQMTRRRALVVNGFATTRAPGTPETPNCDASLDPDALKTLNAIAGNAFSAASGMADNGGAQVIADSVTSTIINSPDSTNIDNLTTAITENIGDTDKPNAEAITNTVVNNIVNNNTPADQALASAVSKQPAFKPSDLQVCKDGSAATIKVFGPP